MRKISSDQFLTTLAETFGVGRRIALGAVASVGLVLLLAVFWFFHSAPPSTIVITTGPEGSMFQMIAGRYSTILARNGVKLDILSSQGSQENLKRLSDRSFRVDIGFVQAGVTNGINTRKLVSLGSVSYEPLLVFYRSAATIELLSELNGKRLAIGAEGSGTRSLALALLDANGIGPTGTTTLLNLDGQGSARALLETNADAAFMAGDSAPPQLMRTLLRSPGIQLYNFMQADGYTRRIHYLNKLEMPRGCIDFGKNIPSHDVYLVGPTVELIARANLHPALSDLLLEAAREVHGRATLFQRKGEFPAPLEQDLPISVDARHYYTSGKSFLYRSLPFWLASLVNRILVVFVPVAVVLIPCLRLIPSLYKWQIRLRLYRWYRALLALERGPLSQMTPAKQEEWLKRLDHIEREVNKMKVPASFADQFYVLRGHIGFVRAGLQGNTTAPH